MTTAISDILNFQKERKKIEKRFQITRQLKKKEPAIAELRVQPLMLKMRILINDCPSPDPLFVFVFAFFFHD